jgi:hypothetical protein
MRLKTQVKYIPVLDAILRPPWKVFSLDVFPMPSKLLSSVKKDLVLVMS